MSQIDDLEAQIRAFCDERDWEQFHDPKELAIGMVTESAELLELFRFQDKDQMRAMLEDPETRRKVGAELADTFYFVLRFADLYGFDLAAELDRKMASNGERYTVEASKGSNQKVEQ